MPGTCHSGRSRGCLRGLSPLARDYRRGRLESPCFVPPDVDEIGAFLGEVLKRLTLPASCSGVSPFFCGMNVGAAKIG